MLSIRIRAALLSLVTLAFASVAQAETDTFNNPKVSGNPLDLCLTWGVDCGKPAADAWCVSKGYTESDGHAVAYDIGLATPTRLISNGAVCDQAFCDGISQVTCVRPDPDQQVYEKPMYHNKRLDLCLNWGVDCGAPAADAWCQYKGWSGASDFVIAEDIGNTRPTKVIGSGETCNEKFCDGFKEITCYN